MGIRSLSFLRSLKFRLIAAVLALVLFLLAAIVTSIQVSSFQRQMEIWQQHFAETRADILELNFWVSRNFYASPREAENIQSQIKDAVLKIDQAFDLLVSEKSAAALPSDLRQNMADSLALTHQYWHAEVRPFVNPLELPKRTSKASSRILDDGLRFKVQRVFDTFSAAFDVATSISHDVINQKLSGFATFQYFLLGFATVCALFVSFFIRWTVLRIDDITQTGRRIMSGELQLRATVRGGDELSLMAESINEMTSKFVREKKYVENILHSMQEMLFTVSPLGRIQIVNDACVRILGYSSTELVGENIQKIFKQDEKIEQYLRSLEERSKPEEWRVRLGTKGSEVVPVAVSGTPLFDESGYFSGAILVMKDMSHYDRLMEESQKVAVAKASAWVEMEKAAEFAELNRQLKATQVNMIASGRFAALGQMAGGIAHEINNPLAIIDGWVNHIRDLSEDGQLTHDQVVTVSAKIDRALARIVRIIRSLRIFSKSESGEPFQQVSVNEVVTDTLNLFREKFQADGIDFTLEAGAPELALEMHCKLGEISQVLINLLSNAYDAVLDREEKWVKMSIQEVQGEAGARIELRVMDSGAGIPENVRSRLMEPFVTTKPVGKGTGLGLSMSRGIIESHQGRFWVDWDRSYTCFVIEIPRFRSQKAA